ncbi:cobalamin biosynthesis protein CobW [Paenibacillus sp. 598K]|uniref:CobW family GTP-binding protein n=1 Tax=Paenibacillus sp. 598K TaxID=1117987 RepID=UPI000FF9BAF8|nr:CobW family GTP-binding protein [Paenibacillus sp. 598K]GBF77238.1 cobalamin biosynthesis protein CobW [Paenibacillus sp. 598K]
MDKRETTVPVHLISGFLGSGKTTLLRRLLDDVQEAGLRPAVVMNELGDVNLDGQLVDDSVPMSEMLSGCICCTIRSDLSMEIKALVDEHRPDVIFIEATGAAHPLEIIDGVTEASLFVPIELQTLITVADGPELLRLARRGGGRTFKLMQEQIRCASRLLLNKIDRLAPEEIVEVEQLVREWNKVAPLIATRNCIVDTALLLDQGIALTEAMAGGGDGAASGGSGVAGRGDGVTDVGVGAAGGRDGATGDGDGVTCIPMDGEAQRSHAHAKDANNDAHSHTHDQHDHTHAEAHDHPHHEHTHAHAHTHEAHAHVMVLTHTFEGPIDSEAFEALLRDLPEEVYRAKGIVTFRDTPSRYMFQYAFRESDFLPIRPQGEVRDVAVFIGEHFSSERLKTALRALESGTSG